MEEEFYNNRIFRSFWTGIFVGVVLFLFAPLIERWYEIVFFLSLIVRNFLNF